MLKTARLTQVSLTIIGLLVAASVCHPVNVVAADASNLSADADSVLNSGASKTGVKTSAITNNDAARGQILNIVFNVIFIFLGLLGAIFLLLIIYAGFLWMTAAGNGSQIEKAREILVQSTIGFAIVFFSLAISYTISQFLEAQIVRS